MLDIRQTQGFATDPQVANRAGAKGVGRNKKGKAEYIAPLRPPTLAAVKPWGNSEGAGRV